MKKFFEKHDLFKLVGICLLVVVAFTWFLKQGDFATGKFAVDTALNRIGLFDVVTYGCTVIDIYFVNIVFVFAVAGFYKFLGSLSAYRELTNRIASAFKGKEKIFVAISILVFACLAGLLNEYFVLIALVPFMISILSNLKVDKVTGVAATFGGIMIGLLGSTYSNVSAVFVNAQVNNGKGLGLGYANELMGTLILFAIAYILLTYLTFARMNAVSKKKDVAFLDDPFVTVVEEKTSKKKKDSKGVSILPIAIILGVLFLNLVLGFISWTGAFNIATFSDMFKTISEATLFGGDVQYVSVILGSVLRAFGEWDLITFIALMLMAALIIKIVYHVPFDKMIEEFGEGAKKITGSVVILIMLYSVLLFSINFMTFTHIVKIITNAGNNIFTIFSSGLVTGVFANDFLYAANTLATFVTGFKDPAVAGLALQAASGLVAFVAPTSIALMFGLSMLDVKYKDWFKYIWKFALAMLVVILIVLAILVYV